MAFYLTILKCRIKLLVAVITNKISTNQNPTRILAVVLAANHLHERKSIVRPAELALVVVVHVVVLTQLLSRVKKNRLVGANGIEPSISPLSVGCFAVELCART